MSIKFNLPKRFFETGSDLLHLIISILLIILGGAFIFQIFFNFKVLFFTKNFAYTVGLILNKIFFALMILEVAHTVVISYQEHVIKPEPFLVVGLIATIRRILAITLNLVETNPHPERFYMTMVEIGVLSLLILILVIGIVILKKYDK
ncbi:MAG: phosphate-starvation-inducible PsiE family protein [Desulfonauticus sp.]|nr:phosphate-starvation-inducible PsiE family protein [Desulfonauticus sp.]